MIDARYTFHPVGQGLFSSGEARFGKTPPLRWVYDCGTGSSPWLLRGAIEALLAPLAPAAADRRQLSLVALSHFDNDHISGLVELA
jgi:glyoxylase-like metal-dependent hydrolase (beta-lactamase superfamily II)